MGEHNDGHVGWRKDDMVNALTHRVEKNFPKQEETLS